MRERLAFLVLPSLVLFGYTVLAQTTATVSGIIRDETGAVLPGVTVTITSVDTGISRTTVSDGEGRYLASGLPLGNYEVEASLIGFQTALRRGIRLTVGRHAVVDVTLTVGELTQEVIVVGEAPLVETTTGTLAALVENKQVTELPLNGKDLTQLVLMQSGIILAPMESERNTGLAKNISVAGARFSQNLYLVDGIMANDVAGNPGGATKGYSGSEAVQEFQVIINNYSAEYRNAPGGIITSVTRSGTNDFHGSVYEFHRNDNLDAKNFFDAEKPEFKRNQFGFAMGGPISKNKTFFFGNYEGLRDRLALTEIFVVPTLEARRGILPGRAPITVAPAVRPYLDLWPAPNGQDHGDGRADFITINRQPTDSDFFTVKIDHQFSPSQSLAGTYAFDDSERDETRRLPQFRTILFNRKQTLSLRAQSIFSSGILNEFRLGYGRTTPGDEQVHLNPRPDLAFVPGQPTLGDLSVSRLTGLGIREAFSADIQNSFQGSDTVTLPRGEHSYKFGFDFQKFQFNTISGSRITGVYEFASLADFLVGQPDQLEVSLPGQFDPTKTINQALFGFYFQDDYRVRPNLTLNLGLRYEFSTTIEERFGDIAGLRSFWDAETQRGPMYDNPTLKNFGPRLGFAWDPMRTGKTSIRGGFGIFYEPPMAFHIKVNLDEIPPFNSVGQLTASRTVQILFPNAVTEQVHLIRSSPRVRSNQFEMDPTYVYRYSLMLQRELGSDSVLTVGYTGTRALHLWRQTDANIGRWIILPDGRKFFPDNNIRLNANFETIRYQFADSNSFYNGLQVDVRKRLSGGLRAQVAYTLSKSVDEASDRSGSSFISESQRYPYAWDRHLVRSLSAFDTRHNAVVNFNWELPFGPGKAIGSGASGAAGKLLEGWELAGIVSLNAGYPASVIGANRRAQRTRIIEDRRLFPDLVPGGNNNPVLGGPDQYFDVSQFKPAEPGFFGTLGRNTLIGPGLANVDFSILKNIRVGEEARVQFRTEVFNVFNRSNFSPPSAEIFDSRGRLDLTGARITSTITTSRQIQFALKFIF